MTTVETPNTLVFSVMADQSNEALAQVKGMCMRAGVTFGELLVMTPIYSRLADTEGARIGWRVHFTIVDIGLRRDRDWLVAASDMDAGITPYVARSVDQS